MHLAFRPFEADDLPVFRSWFADPELARRVSYPDNWWFSHVSSAHSRCWLATDAAGGIVAEVQVDDDPGKPAYIQFVICPSLRGQGLGTLVLSAFLDGPGRTYPTIEGCVEPDNAASLACFRRCGFQKLAEPDQDGFIRLVRHQS